MRIFSARKLLSVYRFTLFLLFFFSTLFPRTFTSGPIGRAGRPWAALSDHGWHPVDSRARCRALALLPSGCCGVSRYRAPAVTAVAGRRARAASAAEQVGAGKQADAPLPRLFFLRAPGLARWIRVWAATLLATVMRELFILCHCMGRNTSGHCNAGPIHALSQYGLQHFWPL